MDLRTQGDYGLRGFIRQIYPDLENRCGVCYGMRAEAAAAYAAENGFDSFTTTLLISPYQNHALLCEIMEKTGKQYGVAFLSRDFRPYFREGQQKAREMGLYMQKYCGCIFSEEERYLKKSEKRKNA
ncbi:Epoxyqueuosine reductase QueH [bioreactor metagenome]|uniref:Epoxyqueuosine reductase QueH n=1 Tax=bioreactor metagenome TaxID=1076179 RepID=A0A645IY10_9ZZZZ